MIGFVRPRNTGKFDFDGLPRAVITDTLPQQPVSCKAQLSKVFQQLLKIQTQNSRIIVSRCQTPKARVKKKVWQRETSRIRLLGPGRLCRHNLKHNR